MPGSWEGRDSDPRMRARDQWGLKLHLQAHIAALLGCKSVPQAPAVAPLDSLLDWGDEMTLGAGVTFYAKQHPFFWSQLIPRQQDSVCFCTTTTEMSTCERNHIASRARNIYYVALYRKS